MIDKEDVVIYDLFLSLALGEMVNLPKASADFGVASGAFFCRICFENDVNISSISGPRDVFLDFCGLLTFGKLGGILTGNQ